MPSLVGMTSLSIILATILILDTSSCLAYVSPAPRIATHRGVVVSSQLTTSSLNPNCKRKQLVLNPTPLSNFSRLNSIQFMTSSSEEDEEKNDDNNEVEEITQKEENTSALEETEKTSFWSKINIFKKKKDDDGLTNRQRLAKMGMSVLLSYGWVSNMSYSVTLSLAWYGFSKQTGQSPLAPGQWKGFLAVYAGFYVFNNIIRPLRLGVSVAVSRYFDDAVNYIQRKTNLSKSLSIGIVVFLANIVGTISAMCLGVSIAAKLAGVPVFPPKVPVA